MQRSNINLKGALVVKNNIKILTFWVLISSLFFGTASANANTQRNVFFLSLKDAEKNFSIKSKNILEKKADAKAALFKAQAQKNLSLPQLNFESSYKYISEIPQVDMGIKQIDMGDNNNYSFGVSASWLLWDDKQIKKAYMSLLALSKAKETIANLTQKIELFKLRVAYYKTQVAIEECHLLKKSLDLAKRQNQDITKNYTSGACSKLDKLNSDRSVANYKLDYTQSLANFSSAFFDLLNVMETTETFKEEETPVPYNLDENGKEIKLDSISDTIKNFNFEDIKFSPQKNLEVVSLGYVQESLKLAYESQKSQDSMQIKLYAKSSYDYPNGPITEDVHQNIVGVSASFPLWDWQINKKLEFEKKQKAKAAQYRKEKKRIEVTKTWEKIQTQIRQSKKQIEVAKDAITLSEKVANLGFDAYKNGKITFVELEEANLKLLKAKVQHLKINAKLLSQMALLETMSY